MAIDMSQELQAMLLELEERTKKYWLVDYKEIIKEQEELKEAVQSWVYKYLWYFWWNGSGKTAQWACIVSKLALWYEGCKKYNIIPIWEKKLIWVWTESGANIQSTIEPYLLWEGSITRIPPEEIERTQYDNQILKEIEMKNGAIVKMFTYDQWRRRVQWWTPDFIWCDEEPTKDDIWKELLARNRSKNCQTLLTMTPLSWRTPVYEFFFENKSEALAKVCKTWFVDSRKNKATDHTWMEWLSPEEIEMRVLWQFVAPTWLVYPHFNRHRNITPHIVPSVNTLWNNVKYYRSLDFWVSHPTAVLFFAVDEDENIYVFDEVYESNMLMQDLASIIKKKSSLIKFEYTLGDSAAARERLELNNLGINIIPADKFSRWENEMSNRRAGIMKVNNLLYNGKLIVSNNCKNLINEFEQHYYKDGAKDWEVIKVNDDLLDALRYFIFSYKTTKVSTRKETEYEKRWKEKSKQRNLLNYSH